MLGVPVKPTIKEADAGGRVVKTLKRAQLWEVQTPQVHSSGEQSQHLEATQFSTGALQSRVVRQVVSMSRWFVAPCFEALLGSSEYVGIATAVYRRDPSLQQ